MQSGSRVEWAILTILVAISCIATSPASAAPFNWCDVPGIVPRGPTDFEPVLGRLARMDDCEVRVENGSSDEAVVLCSPAGAGEQQIWISLTRAPGFGISLLLSTFGLETLDALRSCASSPFKDAESFSSRSIVVRDRLKASDGASLTLINAGPASVSHVYSASGFNAAQIERAYQTAFMGIAPPLAPRSAVRLEGVDPLQLRASKLIDRLQENGGHLVSTGRPDARETVTCVLGGTIMIGAGSVCVHGVFDHIWSITYRLAHRSDFALAVQRLRAQLGAPLSDRDGDCSIYWWQSGDMLARASFCRQDRGNITFINSIVSQQREMLLAQQAKHSLGDE